MQHYNIFQIRICKENFNKVLMQCSHSKHANTIQMWSYNYNIRRNLYVFDANITSIKTLRNVQKMKNVNSMSLLMPKKPK